MLENIKIAIDTSDMEKVEEVLDKVFETISEEEDDKLDALADDETKFRDWMSKHGEEYMETYVKDHEITVIDFEVMAEISVGMMKKFIETL